LVASDQVARSLPRLDPHLLAELGVHRIGRVRIMGQLFDDLTGVVLRIYTDEPDREVEQGDLYAS
jgi:hypothetical protein